MSVQARWAAHANRAVPRYTSYPTAPHFKPDFPAATQVAALGALDPAAAVSLYLHIPFCQSVCWYCGCNMRVAARYEPVAAYAETLRREIDLVADLLPSRLSVSHLHFGGGTPTALSPDDLARIVEALENRFDLSDAAERAIECDPRTLTAEMAAALGRLGFDRASFGIQEFSPHVQAAINRVQPVDTVARGVDMLRSAGVRRMNFDLIYGLPLQTVESLTETVQLCVDMAPDRFALFGYAHVPWMAKNQRMIDAAALPDGPARAAQAGAAADALTRSGYVPVGLDHFARPDDAMAQALKAGTLRRNFQGYTTDRAETLIGFGTTAIGRTPTGYVQNLPDLRGHARTVAAGTLPIGKGLHFGPEDAIRGRAIEALMCQGAVDLAAVDPMARVDWSGTLAALDTLARDGLVDRQGTEIAILPEALPLSRVVAAAFDTYLAQANARHSVAV